MLLLNLSSAIKSGFQLILFLCIIFITFIFFAGCLLPSCQPSPQGVTPIIVLDDLGKVASGQGFGDLLVALENRGPNNAFKLTLGKKNYTKKIN